MIAVILCGGGGTRLWPLSRKNYPKQFLKLVGKNSLLQDTFLRVKQNVSSDKIFIIGNNDNFYNIFNQIKEIDDNYSRDNILIEPASLNTAPAISFAIKHFVDKLNVDISEQILILPSDHYISDVDKYSDLINSINNLNSNQIVTIGIKPDRVETGYGYIRKGEEVGNLYKVLEFKEKPDFETAQKYFLSGEYVWNSGMYIFSVKTFLEEIEKYCPEIYDLISKDYDFFKDNFKTLPNISIDYALSEKSSNVLVASANFDWSDIGSFDRLAENSDSRNINIESNNIFSFSASNKLIVTFGVEDLNIIENNDAILIQKRGRGEETRKVVEYLKQKNIAELDDNIIVHRPWGKYEILIDTQNYKVKKITVYPGCKLSLQSHKHRSESWIVVGGAADVINGDEHLMLFKNDSTHIPFNTVHRLSNPGKINLEIIEIQTGEYIEEDDIERYDDVYGRS